MGENNPMSKLNELEVRQILNRRKSGATYSQLGVEFNISPTYAGDIINGKTWKHITAAS
jgi:hypothetical protein